MLPHFPLCVCHRRSISTFLNNLMIFDYLFYFSFNSIIHTYRRDLAKVRMRRQAAGHWGTLPAKSDDPLLVRPKILFNTYIAWVTTFWSHLALLIVFWTLCEPQRVTILRQFLGLYWWSESHLSDTQLILYWHDSQFPRGLTLGHFF